MATRQPTFQQVRPASEAGVIGTGIAASRDIISGLQDAIGTVGSTADRVQEGRIDKLDDTARKQLEVLECNQQCCKSGEVLSREALLESVANITSGSRLNVEDEQARLMGTHEKRIDSLLDREAESYKQSQLQGARALRNSFNDAEGLLGVKDVDYNTANITLATDKELEQYVRSKKGNEELTDDQVTEQVLVASEAASKAKADILSTNFGLHDEAARETALGAIAEKYGRTVKDVSDSFGLVDLNKAHGRTLDDEQQAARRKEIGIQGVQSNRATKQLVIDKAVEQNRGFEEVLQENAVVDAPVALIDKARVTIPDIGKSHANLDEVGNKGSQKIKRLWSDLIKDEPEILASLDIKNTGKDLQHNIPGFVMRDLLDNIEIDRPFFSYFADDKITTEDANIKNYLRAAAHKYNKGMSNRAKIVEMQNNLRKETQIGLQFQEEAAETLRREQSDKAQVIVPGLLRSLNRNN